MLRATEPLIENEGEWQVIGERFRELADGMRVVCSHQTLRARANELDELALKFQASS